MKEGIFVKSSMGKTLRKVRKGKQVSITSISDEHLSKSQISRFERGESEISCVRLINILDKLHISLDEFLVLHKNENSKYLDFTSLLIYIRKQYMAQNIKNLTDLLSSNSSYTLNSFEKTMVKSIIYTLDNSVKPKDNDILQLTDYLFKVDQWGYYEIILLGNCARTIEYNSFFLLTKEMVKNHIYSSLNKTNKKLVTQLAINCLFLSIDNNQYENCSFLITEIKKLLTNEFNFYEETVFLYATGYFEFKKGSNNDTTKMKQAIQVFELLGENELKEQYTEHYSKIVD